jgi:hypothetical protein
MMAVPVAATRSIEEATLFNPAFIAALLHRAIGGFERETQQGIPLPLLYLVPPVALVRATRQLLPGRVDTSLPGWLQEHPEVRLQFAENARALVPVTRDGLLFGVARGVIFIDGDRIRQKPFPHGAAAAMGRNTKDFQEVLNRANFVGRWYAHAGSQQTIMTFWGVRP